MGQSALSLLRRRRPHVGRRALLAVASPTSTCTLHRCSLRCDHAASCQAAAQAHSARNARPRRDHPAQTHGAMTARGDEPLGSAAAPGAGSEARASESSPPAAAPPLLPVGGAILGELPPPEYSSSLPKLHPSDFKRSTSVAPSEGGSSEGSSSGVSPHFPYDAQKDVVLRLEFLGPREVKARGWQLGAKRVRGPVQSAIAAPGRRPSPACPLRPPAAGHHPGGAGGGTGGAGHADCGSVAQD